MPTEYHPLLPQDYQVTDSVAMYEEPKDQTLQKVQATLIREENAYVAASDFFRHIADGH